MKYFVIFGLMIFLGVTLFIDIFKYFIGPEHWSGLHIVPVVLLANLFLGIFYNLSIWYKLNDLTRYGALIALSGSVITVLMNLLLVPKFSFVGAAWGHFACYAIMMLISYFLGKKYYPVPYEIKKIVSYLMIAVLIFLVHYLVKPDIFWLRIVTSALLFIVFLVLVYVREKPRFKGSD
jgi:O-antigen/teichoic acid export membrane protein